MATLTELIADAEQKTGLTADAGGTMTLDVGDVTATIAPHLIGAVLWWRVEVRRGSTQGGRGICAVDGVRHLAETLAAGMEGA